jgi:hypothetical protein
MRLAEQLRSKVDISSIFIATDSPDIIRESVAYRDRWNIMTIDALRLEGNVHSQYTIIQNPSLAFGMTVGVIRDISFLSQCQYFIGTCMSQVSRVSVELAIANNILLADPVAVDLQLCNSYSARHFYAMETPWVSNF